MSNDVTSGESDIAILFATDPLELTDDDIDTIVRLQRKARHTFQLNEEKNKALGKKPKVKLTGMTAKQLIL